jgi:hypothetical protein
MTRWGKVVPYTCLEAEFSTLQILDKKILRIKHYEYTIIFGKFMN